MKYRLIFRCRLCRETFEEGNTYMAASISGLADITNRHECDEGRIGLADFVGLKESTED